MNSTTPRRGHVYRVTLGDEAPILCLAISINTLNAKRKKYITALVTSDRSAPPDLPDWVRLGTGDPVFGHVVCSDIGMIHRDEILEDLGDLSLETQIKVNQALKRTLGL